MKVKLLVPTDFSDVAHSAIQHAVKFSSIINAELILLHVVETREGIESAKEKLSKDEIIKNIDKLKKDLFNLRFQKINTQVTNPAKIGETKKTIARLKTSLQEKINA